MFVEVALVVFCLVLVILIMIFSNPPEAWIKKVFHGKAGSQAGVKSRRSILVLCFVW